MSNQKSASAHIAETLSKFGIILYKQLAYLSNQTVAESRIQMQEYLDTNASTTHPLYIVGGFRYIHGQFAMAYLITRPSLLESTKAKYEAVVSVQLYGLTSGPCEPDSLTLQNLITSAQSHILSLQATQHAEKPVLAPNAFRTNSFSNIILAQPIERSAKAYASSIKLIESTVFIAPSLLSNTDSGADIISSTAFDPSKKEKDASIVKQTNKLNFGAPTLKSTETKKSAFDMIDDDDMVISKSIPKRTSSFSTKTSSESKTPTATTPIVSRSVFDEFDDDDLSTTMVPKSKANLATSTKLASKTPASFRKTSKANMLIESDVETDSDEEGFNGFSHTLLSEDDIGDDNDNDGNNDEDENGEDLFSEEEQKTTEITINGRRVLIDSEDESDTDSIKKKPEKKSQNKSSKINEETDSDDDYDKHVQKTVQSKTTRKSTELSQQEDGYFGRMSKEEYDEFCAKNGIQQKRNLKGLSKEEKDELTKERKQADAAQKEAKKAADLEVAKNNSIFITKLNTKTSNDHDFRVHPETGIKQRRVIVKETTTVMDEDGFEETKLIEVEKWVDVHSAVTAKKDIPPPAPSVAPFPAKATTTKPKEKKEEEKKEKTQQKSITSFFKK